MFEMLLSYYDIEENNREEDDLSSFKGMTHYQKEENISHYACMQKENFQPL